MASCASGEHGAASPARVLELGEERDPQPDSRERASASKLLIMLRTWLVNSPPERAKEQIQLGTRRGSNCGAVTRAVLELGRSRRGSSAQCSSGAAPADSCGITAAPANSARALRTARATAAAPRKLIRNGITVIRLVTIPPPCRSRQILLPTLPGLPAHFSNSIRNTLQQV